MHIEGAIEQIHGLNAELEDIKIAATNGSLVPLPGESVSTTAYYAQSSQ